MLQAYSTNISIDANTAIPFNNVAVDKGCAEALLAPASVQLNQRGVYLIEVDGFGTGATAGTDTIQLVVNGVPQAQAISSFTAATTDISNFSFKTFVRVAENNCPCNCISSPTIVQVLNGAVALDTGHINIVITKIC